MIGHDPHELAAYRYITRIRANRNRRHDEQLQEVMDKLFRAIHGLPSPGLAIRTR